ncbi:MAG: MMPL family transporter [Actinobacteria bacterium]|nr:MMPL family transporter [Actinomycetota bacterium]
MKKFWSNLAVQLGKRAGLVSIVGLAMTLLLGLGIPKLEFATGQDSYLNKNDQVAKDNVAYQKLFGGQIMLVLFTMDEGHSVAELATPENAKAIEDAKAEILKSPEVYAVVSPLDTLQYSANSLSRTPEDPTNADAWEPLSSIAATATNAALAAEKPESAAAKAREADFAETAERLGPFLASTADQRVLSNPEWVDVLLHDNNGDIRKPLKSSFFDERHAQMIVRLKGNASIEVEGAGATAVKQAWADRTIQDGDVLVTGAPVLLKDINDYLRGGIMSLGAIAIAIMVVILLLFFHVRWRLLPLLVIIIGVIWAFGLAGYLGIPLSIVTIAGLPVMLGVGIDYAIQMHARVEEEVVIDRADHPIQETARNLGPALLVVTFDAIFAFAALRFAKVPMIRDFGLLLCVGIAVICLSSIIWPLAILGIREYRSPTTGRDFREGALGRLVVWLGSLPAKIAPILIAASLVIFVGGIITEGKLTLQTDPVQWVNQQSQNRKDVATLEERTDASSELGIFVEADSLDEIFSDETVQWVEDFTNDSIERYPDLLLVASSIVSPLADLVDIEGANNFVPSGDLIRASYLSAPPDIQKFTISEDPSALNILFVTRPANLEERAVMTDEMQVRLKEPAPAGIQPPEGVQATPSGLAVVGVGLLRNLESNRVELTYLSIFLVFAFLTVRLRSLVRSLLSLVPVLIAVGMASLVAFAFSLKLSPMTAVGGPLVIAVCTEFTSLILLRFIEERARGLSPQAAADVTAARTGRAFIVSAMTAVTGVAVIATSSLPLLRDFGIIVAMNVAVALASALVVLPPMLVWADAEGRSWVSRGLMRPHDAPYVPTDHRV